MIGSGRSEPDHVVASPMAREKVEFQVGEDAAGVAAFGPFSTSTKDGLVHVTEEDKHVGTIFLGRWIPRTYAQCCLGG